jgi:hypothetical protein
MGGQMQDGFAAEKDIAFIRVVEACDHAQERGLAAAAGAEQGEEFTVAYSEVDVIDHGVLAESLDDVL